MRDNQPSMAFKDLAPKADFYRETIPYKPFVNKEREKQIKLNMTENEVRYCLNWACEKEYKQIENKKRKACRCHPGVFDFGHTAPTVEQSVEEYQKNDKDSLILWKPQ